MSHLLESLLLWSWKMAFVSIHGALMNTEKGAVQTVLGSGRRRLFCLSFQKNACLKYKWEKQLDLSSRYSYLRGLKRSFTSMTVQDLQWLMNTPLCICFNIVNWTSKMKYSIVSIPVWVGVIFALHKRKNMLIFLYVLSLFKYRRFYLMIEL